MPATLAVLALSLHSYQRERAAIERANLDVARALVQAVDLELVSARAALQALATSPSLDRNDLRSFHAQAIAVLRDRPGNVVVLTDRGLQQLDNSGKPREAPLPAHGNPDAVRHVFASARSAVSDLYHAPTVRRLLASVDVPVMRDGRVRWVLSMQYDGERLGSILARQRLPAGVSAAIYDGAARVIWGSGGRPQAGSSAGAALATGLALGPEGIVEETGDGTDRVVMFSRSSASNWTVAIALSHSALNASLWHALRWIVLGTLLLLVLGYALVSMVGARFERAVLGLVRPAVALGRGEQVVLPPLPLDEAQDVGHALVRTAALLHERTVQRDEAERAERGLREAKRVVERSEAFLRGIFEETPDGIFLVQDDCRIVRANSQAERMFGWPAGALAGQLLDDVLLDTDGDGAVCARMRDAQERNGMAGNSKLRGRRGDGSLFPADAMANMLPEHALLIVTVRDVTSGWRQEQALRQALQDKSILLKELSHRVKNNLQLIISLFNLQARALGDTGARQALQEAAGRVRAMALVHERLYRSPTLASIPIRDYVAGVCEQLANAASAPARGIALVQEVDALECGVDTAVPLGLMLNELVSNSLKHAFPDGRRGTVRVRLARVPDGAAQECPGPPDAGRTAAAAAEPTMCLTVVDDGVGLPPDLDRTSPHTFGLKLVSALSDQLHARLSLSRGDHGGTCAAIVFRLPAADWRSAGHGNDPAGCRPPHNGNAGVPPAHGPKTP